MRLIIFDLDETLFRTKAKVLVVKGQTVIKRLNNQEYNKYKLAFGEQFDYGEFSDAKLFNQTSKPISKTVKTLKTYLRNARLSDSKVIIVTARPDFDNKDLFLETFRKFDIEVDKLYIERAGNLEKKTAAESKTVIFKRYLDTNKYHNILLFDDCVENIKALLVLSADYTKVCFEAYLVSTNAYREVNIRKISSDGFKKKG